MVKDVLVEKLLSRNHGQPADGEASESWDTHAFSFSTGLGLGELLSRDSPTSPVL